MSRKLASIQIIDEIDTIEGADKIEYAKVLGWHVVIEKGKFKVGDKCVYCEVDSVLPEIPVFEFLRQRKFRIKTIRLKGKVSQGICFPFSIMDICNYEKLGIGDDVTEQIGVKKFEPPIPACLMGEVLGKFPSFIPKTDEASVQVLQDALTRHNGIMCYVTEKLDGTSVTYFIKDGVFGVCSRNLQLKEKEGNTYWTIARNYKIEEKLKQVSVEIGIKNVAIQGEIIGNGIQKCPYKLIGQKVFFFNFFDIDKFRYFNYEELKDVFFKMMLPLVPIIRERYELSNNIDELVELSKGKSLLCDDIREGIVIRPLFEGFDLQMAQGFGNGRISFKAVNPDYLLKFGE